MTKVSKKSPIWMIIVFAMIISAILRPPGTMVSFEGGSATYIICSDAGITTITVPHPENDSPNNSNSQNFCNFFTSKTAALPLPLLDITLATQHDIINNIAKNSYNLISFIRLTTHSSRAPPLLV